ncbi:type IV pilin [Methanosarcina sp. MSH10X1]|uniref:type IV pilin n=1 Tax=Methanosarcina sp. MSH10X1 TaxID=2507075 RepID=UPI000FFCA19D|nr:type IV pilin [Methanosarcina sp. MSH10X1]RXA21341.1 type IV pilin [Methanosarcina sp. MSH10X1]
MVIKKLFMNNKAVSPVIGVILMVAITVILAAAIGSSVFGQGTAESAPQANLDIESAGISSEIAYAKFEHLGGDPINFAASATRVVASVNGATSQELDVTDNEDLTTPLTTLAVGEVQKIELMTSSGNLKDNSEGATATGIASGDIVNIKVIDIKTNQLICDRDIRF